MSEEITKSTPQALRKWTEDVVKSPEYQTKRFVGTIEHHELPFVDADQELHFEQLYNAQLGHIVNCVGSIMGPMMGAFNGSKPPADRYWTYLAALGLLGGALTAFPEESEKASALMFGSAQASLVENLVIPRVSHELIKRKMAIMFMRNVELFNEKQKDYGPYNIETAGWRGVILRTNDKYQRLQNLNLYERAAVSEPLVDSFSDIFNYSYIGLMCSKGIWSLFSNDPGFIPPKKLLVTFDTKTGFSDAAKGSN
jgi:hypothetical protein